MKKLLFAALTALLLLPLGAKAEGYLFVSPQRVDLDEETKIGQLRLVNKSENPKQYEVKLVTYGMDSRGALSLVEELPYSAKKFIRYSPRRITLQPGEDQYVRVMSRFPKDLQEGGYHIHIEFNEVEGAFARSANNEASEGNVSFEIASTYNVAIPIFVTKGDITSDVDLLEVTPKVLKGSDKGEAIVKMKRIGNDTSYHLVRVHYTDSQGKTHLAATPAKISVYREVDEVDRKFRLKLPEGVRFNGGEIKVSLYPVDSKDEGNPLDAVTAKVR